MTKNVKEKQGIQNQRLLTDFSLPCIHINTNREAVIDGCRGVIEYTDKNVRINCKSLILKFSGENLSIKTVTSDQYIVTGEIINLEFYSS